MSASGQNNVDFDNLIDFGEYDAVSNYQSPSLSPNTASKPTFASPITTAVTTPSVSSTQQAMSGPSHNYEQYRQQTGFVPGAIANTMAVNQTNNTGYQDYNSLSYLSSFTPEDNLFDFNTSPSQVTLGGSDLEMDFESPSDAQNFLSTVNPSSIEQDATAMASPASAHTQTSNVGRLWPGAHSQAAMAKAQAQQRQQIMQQQQQQQRQSSQQPQKPRGKAPQQTDPLVEQKITQLLNSMRAKPADADALNQANLGNLPRAKKEDDEMDEDERLLASEEGKKLSSKERRQLRNKVSARAFRSRRKEYITQLESEIAAKVNENGELRVQNRALVDENKRLQELTRMLLSSSSFSTFLDDLSTNPAALPQAPQQIKVEEPQQQQQQQRQLPKDVNAFGAQPSQQQIGMAMIPEQTMDFSMLSLDNNFNFQPQVFVVDTPEIPAPIDTAALSGKASNFVEETFETEEKLDVPVIEHPVEAPKASVVAPSDPEFESDPDFALFHSEPVATDSTNEVNTVNLTNPDVFSGITSEKGPSQYALVDATEEEANAVSAILRVQRISDDLESLTSRLELFTMDL
ncbi:bZIP transcription factor domain-containing protein [Sarocladium implicatum]|nr:bZIP transcription factor domain-containing protein [Sarocladium implicatum]